MRKIILVATILTISSTVFGAGPMPFLQKMLSDVPDNYGIRIIYVNGKEESFELASHQFTKESGVFEFVTKDDMWNWVPMSSVLRIEFDKRFSKMISLREKELQKTSKP